MGIIEKIKEIEAEMARTQKNKATEYHLGQLKAKIAKLRTQLLEPPKGTSGAGEGFEVTKYGHGRVALIGFPSVGKSTLLTMLTGTHSEAASYEFTTLTCIPGIIHYNGTKIQLLDLPGIIEGASEGKGRGRQVIAVSKSSDIVLMVLDASKSEGHRQILTKELEAVGLRLNKKPPQIYFKKKKTGGISFNSTAPLTHLDEKLCYQILHEYKIHNAETMEKFDQAGTLKLTALNNYGTDLTRMAEQNKLDPVIGRRDEIEQVTQILCKRRKNNVCLTGDPGVGKTVIVESLASRIIDGTVPVELQGSKVFSIDMGRLTVGTRSESMARLIEVVNEVKLSEGKIVLFIDELHTIVGDDGPLDASNILKSALARGELKCVGATTREEYRKYIEKDGAIKRHFQVVDVPEPSVQDTILILKGLIKKYETFHNVKYTDTAIHLASSLAKQYISERFLPEKAIDLIDEAGTTVNLKRKQVDTNEKALANEMDKNLCSRDNLQPEQAKNNDNMLVTEMDIRQVLSSWTGIPVEKISQEEPLKLRNMEKTLHTKVIGQKEAVTSVSRAIRRANVGIRDPNRPIASFLFTGPTGVGKTELAKVVSQEYFGSKQAMVRIDMSEYMAKHEVSKLIGAPPGYVGHHDGGQLTEAIKKRPHNLVLFDEIEKAHPDVFDAMLQILDDGRLTDGKGCVVDFTNTIIILTSNIGGHLNGKFEQVKLQVSELLKKKFRPEFLNRLDDVIVFQQQNKAYLRMIVKLMLKEFIERVKEKKDIDIKITDKVHEKVLEEGYNPSYGARPLRRAVTRILEDYLSDKILCGAVKKGDSVTVDVNSQGEIIFY